MTMPPIIPPQMPKFDPTNPWQCAEYFGRWLLQTDPDEFAACLKRVQDWAVYVAVEGIEKGMLMHGFKRGNRNQRKDAYIRKYNWPMDRGADGMLLHPVMITQMDPLTGQPFQAPSEQGEDLWDVQLRVFPRQFLIDARDAYDMGAPLPPWVVQLVEETVQHEATPEGKKALVSAVETKREKKALVAA